MSNFLKATAFKTFLCLLIVAVLSGCKATTEKSSIAPANALSNLVIAEPNRAGYRAQHALMRLNQIALNEQLSDEERAQVFFQRGLVYDKVGLAGLAYVDFKQAIDLNPNMPDVFNSLGVYYNAVGNFEAAYEALDATLEMDPQYAFAFFNRALTSYYHGRYQLAYDDMNTYYELDPTDPLRALWRFYIAYQVSPQAAMAELRDAQLQIPDTQWALQIVAFYNGDISQAALLDDVLEGVGNQQQLNERLCELYFYLGKYHAIQGNKVLANNFYKLSLSTNVYEFVEHRFARVELNKLREDQ